MGLLGNVAEVKELRSRLMTSELLTTFADLLDSNSDGIEVSRYRLWCSFGSLPDTATTILLACYWAEILITKYHQEEAILSSPLVFWYIQYIYFYITGILLISFYINMYNILYSNIISVFRWATMQQGCCLTSPVVVLKHGPLSVPPGPRFWKGWWLP